MNCGLASGMISSLIQKASKGSVSSLSWSQVGFQCAKSTIFGAETEAAAWLVPEVRLGAGQQVVFFTGQFSATYPRSKPWLLSYVWYLKEKVLHLSVSFSSVGQGSQASTGSLQIYISHADNQPEDPHIKVSSALGKSASPACLKITNSS